MTKKETYIYTETKERKKFCGISVRRIIGYLIIYSFLGFMIETIYGVVSIGVIESRQSFLYGPFCTIYGVGAIAMLLPLKKLNTKNYILMFVTSAIIGCTVEYIVSWFGETFLHVKWWDYTDYFLNINGRVCLYYGIFWGILGIWLIKRLNPKVDDLIDKVKEIVPANKHMLLMLLVLIFLIADCAVTVIAIDLYQTRVIVENNINVKNKVYYIHHYHDIYDNDEIRNRIELVWGNEFMIKTFPNLRIQDATGEVIYLNSFYKDIESYYFKVYSQNVPSE